METRKKVGVGMNTIKKALLGLAGLTAAGAVLWVSVARPVQARSEHEQMAKENKDQMINMMSQHHGENRKEGCTKMMKELDYE